MSKLEMLLVSMELWCVVKAPLTACKTPKEGPSLIDLVRDAWRFIASYGRVMAEVPLQTYGSALVFSPSTNNVRNKYWEERLRFVKMVERIGERNVCLQVLEGHGSAVETDKTIAELSFSEDGRCLITDQGSFSISTGDLASSTPQGQEPLDPALLFVDDDWVVRCGKRLLWLPMDYRPTSSAVYGDLMVLGHRSGGMTFLWFDFASS